jgi:GGDEF domain-containing protein
VRDEHGRILYYEGTLTDITEAHELSRQLSYEASHDALSGLINRREFEIRLQRALDSAQATGAVHAVCYLDLDQFKGHQRHLRAHRRRRAAADSWRRF